MPTQTPRCNCRRHAETYLRCARCSAPICPDCSVITPTGMICRECGAKARSPLYQVEPHRLASAFVVCLAVSTVLGWLFRAFGLGFGFFGLWIAFFYGGAIGELALRVTGRKRGVQLEAVAGCSAGLGMLLGMFIVVAPYLGPERPFVTMLMHQGPWFFISLVIVVMAAIGRVRYI